MSKIEQFKLGFSSEKATIYSNEIITNSLAVKVFQEIVHCHSEIKTLFYVKYNPYQEPGYNDDFNIPDLYELSPLLLSEKNLRRIDSDAHKKEEIFGVASKLILTNGSEAHIPMMDFYCSKTEENLAEIEKIMSPFHGFILDSGNAYHYWGMQLMNKEEWQNFINYCDHHKNTDKGYIDASRFRGFCVLRIFEHFDPIENEMSKAEPKVVKVLR